MAWRGRRVTNRPDAHRREVIRGEAREHVRVDALLDEARQQLREVELGEAAFLRAGLDLSDT